MSAATTAVRSSLHRVAVRGLAPALLVGAAALTCGAQEADRPGFDGYSLVNMNPSAPAQPLFEVNASALARFDVPSRNERMERVERIDMSLLTPGTSAVGVAVGLTGLSQPSQPLMGTALDLAPGLSLGVQWRSTLEGRNRIDVTAWRNMTAPTDPVSLIQQRQPTYGARVEMSVSPVRRSGLVADRGFIGVQLDGGARIALKRSEGRPMLYYRNKF